MQEQLEPSVQFDDWRGTISADSHDHTTVQHILSERGLKTDKEFVVGVSVYAGPKGFACITAHLVEATDFAAAKTYLNSTPVPRVREVTVDDLSIHEICQMFKRFSAVLSFKGMKLADRELDIH